MTAASATATPGTVHVVLPGDVDDPTVPSGGNTYDRRVCQGLAAQGWRVDEIAAPGAWPHPDPTARAALARRLAALPDGDPVLLDGLVACAAPDVVVAQTTRLRPVVLVHLPLADETGLPPTVAADLHAREHATLRAASAVVATSPWAARRLVDRHELPENRVHVAPPGTDPAPPAPGTDGASRLLCVAALTPTKGHDLLIEALATLTDLPWSCVCVGSRRRAPAYAARLRDRIDHLGLDARVSLPGPSSGDHLAAHYAAADLVVLASRAETYGMVVTEALARGVPVLATNVGGLPDTLGYAPDGSRPGMLVPPETPALADALRRWLGEPELRHQLRGAARRRRGMLGGWQQTAQRLAEVLATLRPDTGRTT
ncbi:glycosyltransferase family 4 protein [Salinactinospora qingdaonensis]|uniref:Glycosyltransferase family 4 protein n=1 Tax=Salinactinospora qingdaonensis TaxID=702744 RepID=A0ABP7FVR7_9ACTN